MRGRRWLTGALLAALLLLPGCWDRAEIEDQAYVVVVGLDRLPQRQYQVTAVVALVQVQSAGTLKAPATPAHPQLAAQFLTARAPTFSAALQVLNGGMTRRLDIRHLRAVVVGESMGRAGLQPLVLELMRSPLFRGSSLVIQARGTARDLLMALQPVGEMNPARMAEGLNLESKHLHLAPPTLFHHFLNRLMSGGTDAYLPTAAINPGVRGRRPAPAAAGLQAALPGELQRSGGNPVELVGTAVYRRDRLAGLLTVGETQVLLALRGKLGKTSVTFPDPSAPGEAVTIRFHQENLPGYRAAFRQGRPRVEVRLSFEGEVEATPSGVDYSAEPARRRLERAAEAHVQRTAGQVVQKLRSWQADPVGFGQLYRGRFATWPEWQAYDWHRHVGELAVQVTARMRLRRYGLLLGSVRQGEGR